jgi:hypothetical protein
MELDDASVSELCTRLDRAEDNHEFLRDIKDTYPHLDEQYAKVCPNRMFLERMRFKALEGRYRGPTGLQKFKDDLDLIVNNCKAFNQPGEWIVTRAIDFHQFSYAEAERAWSKQMAARKSTGRIKASQKRPRGPSPLPMLTPTVPSPAAPVAAPPPPSVPLQPVSRPTPPKFGSLLDLPERLKLIVDEQHKEAYPSLGGLPQRVTVTSILRRFLQFMKQQPAVNYAAYVNVVKTIMDTFNSALPRVLLYNSERSELLVYCAQNDIDILGQVDWCSVFGAVHLLRLVVWMPSATFRVAHNSSNDEEAAEVVMYAYASVLQDALMFMDRFADKIGL